VRARFALGLVSPPRALAAETMSIVAMEIADDAIGR
jgi:hypothetical protein